MAIRLLELFRERLALRPQGVEHLHLGRVEILWQHATTVRRNASRGNEPESYPPQLARIKEPRDTTPTPIVSRIPLLESPLRACYQDFIAAAEFLIAEGYTSPTRLATQGESNGGQLVAAVMTQRPDLFAVAIAGVPQTDNLRYDRGRHRGQFGSPADSAHFPSLFAYSPLHHVRPGTCYPATLITTALNDNRSPAWLAMKFAATLQSAQSCLRPVLLQAHLSGGHYGNRAPESNIEDATDVLTFIASQLGRRPPSPPVRAKGDSLPNVESPDPDGHRSPFR